MNILKQSTQVKVPMGPFVDATDGGTLETSISFATTEANIIKHDAPAVVDIGVNAWSSHLGGGYYNVTLTASNTDTLGMLVVEAHDTAARPVRREFMVVPANIYDSLILGTDYAQVDVIQINGNASSGFLTGTDHLKADVQQINASTAAADNLSQGALALVTATAQTNSTTTVVKTNLTEATNDHYNGRTLTFTSGSLTGQSTTISDYSGSSKDLTVVALTEAPSNGDTFVIS